MAEIWSPNVNTRTTGTIEGAGAGSMACMDAVGTQVSTGEQLVTNGSENLQRQHSVGNPKDIFVCHSFNQQLQSAHSACACLQ